MAKTAIDVHVIKTEEEIKHAFNLRRDVFMGEQGVTEDEEFDGLDDGDNCTHYLAKVAGMSAGTVRLYKKQNSLKLQRLCVAKNYRGFGVGRKIVEKVIADAKKNGIQTIELEAQTHAIGFYQSFGFKAYGDEFMDARIPHRKMKLEL